MEAEDYFCQVEPYPDWTPVRTYERLEGLGDPCPGIPGQPNPPNPGEFEPEGPVIGALDAQMKAVLLSASHIYDAVRSMLKG